MHQLYWKADTVMGSTHLEIGRKPTSSRILPVILLTFIALGLIVWGAVLFTRVTGTGADFLNRWVPVRLMLTEGLQNPYSEEAVLRTQMVRYGHPALPGQTPCLFAYPFYAVLLYLPFAWIGDFVLARSLWLLVSAASQVALVLLATKILEFKPGKVLLTVMLLYAVFSADMAQSLIDGNPASLAALFAWMAVFLVHRRHDRVAGIMLALSTVKPQLVVLFLPLMWLWAVSNRRWLVLLYTLLTLTMLAGGSFVLFPGWLNAFVSQITTYSGMASPSIPAAILPYWMPASTAAAAAVALTVLSLGLIAWSWIRVWSRGTDSLLWTASLTFALMPLTGITSAKSNFTTMIPAVVLVVFAAWQKEKTRTWLVPALLAAAAVSWVAFLIGRESVYFVDFYPLPLAMTAGFMAIRRKYFRPDPPASPSDAENLL